MRKTIEISDFKMMMFLILRRQPEGQGSFLGSKAQIFGFQPLV